MYRLLFWDKDILHAWSSPFKMRLEDIRIVEMDSKKVLCGQ